MPPLDQQRIREQSARLRRLAAAIVGDSLADDVLQDVWVAALDGPRQQPTHSPAWLARVTRNLAWRRRIGDSRRRAREKRASSSEKLESLEEWVSKIEEGHLLERALLELDEPYRKTLLWRYYDELSISHISRRSGQPESTTRTHLQRGLERLRERLKSEQGPDWRACLLPLLRVPRGAPSAAGTAAGLGGVLVASLLKPMLLVAVLVASWAGYQRFGAMEESLPAVAPPVALESVALLEGPAVREFERLPFDSVGSRLELDSASGRPKNSELEAPASTPASVLDPVSGLGVPGLTLRVSHSGESYELTCDDLGQVSLPFVITESERQTARPYLWAEALISGSQEYLIPINVREEPGSERLDLQLVDACVAWVRLPTRLTETEFEKLSASISLVLENGGVISNPPRYAPILAHGTDLLFVLPCDQGSEQLASKLKERVLKMNIKSRGSFSVRLPLTASLAGGPYIAQERRLVQQRLVVRCKQTGLPVPGAFVSLRRSGAENFAMVEFASGLTDEQGLVELQGVPPGSALALFNRKGFKLTFTEVEVTGAASLIELELPEVAGKSDLEVVLKLARGPVPRLLSVTVFSSPRGAMAGSQILHPVPDDSGGWSARTTLVDLPPGDCSIKVTSDWPGVGTREPIRSRLPRGLIEIELDTPPATRPLRLALPEGLSSADFWIDRFDYSADKHGRLRRTCTSAMDGAQLAQVTEHREPRNWLVAREGYLPVFGREDAWSAELEKRPAGLFHRKKKRKPFFRLTPKLEPGQGSVLRLVSDAGYVQGAQVLDPESGTLLAITDERGFALLRDVREGDRLRLVAEGYEGRVIELGDWPLERCWLQAMRPAHDDLPLTGAASPLWRKPG